jgi:anti-sigma factor ChrR (cupin superfamily)
VVYIHEGKDDGFRLNAEFDQRVVIRPDDYAWVDSPESGVRRMMLDRVSMENSHSSTIVEFKANSEFPHHVHYMGEELLVLEGVFADEYGEYPAGTYFRNPPGTSHVASVGESGAKVFVKLHQMQENDQAQFSIDTKTAKWLPGMVAGLQVMPLHEHGAEHVALVKWAPHTQFSPHQHWGGEEIFVLEGTFYDEHGEYPQGTWLRSPHLSKHTPFTKDDGAIIFVKTRHRAWQKFSRQQKNR